MSDARPVIFIAQPHLAPLLGALAADYDAMPLWEDAGRAHLNDARALVTAGEFRLDPALIAAMPRLGLIACFTVGYDGVDLNLARERGIAVAHAGNANADDAADHGIGLMLAHRRWIVEGDRHVRAGLWTPQAKTITRSMSGARLGIVGMGAIGVAVAQRAQAMKMQVHWWGPRDKPALPWTRAESLMALAQDSDILLVAARAEAANRGLISAAIIDALGPEGLIVNIARGQLVDEAALIDALKARRLGGAALDVFDPEPTDPARWIDVPNVVLTPHTGGATQEAVGRMMDMLRANLAAHFAGTPLPAQIC